jgi:hypothetical protein
MDPPVGRTQSVDAADPPCSDDPLASTLFGIEPDYERVVVLLLASGTQGLQFALLTPGWIHGCLGYGSGCATIHG